MASSFLSRIAEERIHDAQQRGVFDNLPGRGKPIPSHDLRAVPEDLRLAYHILKNAHILPPEAALHKEIHQLQDLLRYIEEDGQRKALVKEIEWKNDPPRSVQTALILVRHEPLLRPQADPQTVTPKRLSPVCRSSFIVLRSAFLYFPSSGRSPIPRQLP